MRVNHSLLKKKSLDLLKKKSFDKDHLYSNQCDIFMITHLVSAADIFILHFIQTFDHCLMLILDCNRLWVRSQLKWVLNACNYYFWKLKIWIFLKYKILHKYKRKYIHEQWMSNLITSELIQTRKTCWALLSQKIDCCS